MHRSEVSQFIEKKLVEAKTRNPRTSLRSFSFRLGISPASLSQVISGKRKLSVKTLNKVLALLDMESSERIRLLGVHALGEGGVPSANQAKILNGDALRLMTQWIYPATLSLLTTPGSVAKADWISEKMGVSEAQMNRVLQQLVEHEFLAISKQGKHQVLLPQSKTTEDIPSSYIQLSHQEMLEQARVALREQKVNERDFSSTIFAFDENKVDQIKAEIRKFRNRIQTLSRQNSNGKSVFRLGVVFYSLTQGVKKDA